MSDPIRCPSCKGRIPVGQPPGLCPVCALDHLVSDCAVTPPSPDQPLVTVIGQYELLGEIARGGMGVVYRARQRSLDRLVAVKLLLTGPRADPEFVRRFQSEATAAAALHHPNIVAIHEVGVDHGEHYIAMELVEGPNLAQLTKTRPPTPIQAAGYLRTIARAVDYAHERGFLHRDLKPSNVLIDPDDQPRITDFGLAKRLGTGTDPASDPTQLTVTGQVMGSPGYMPPEQAAGGRNQVSRRSDVYSLGAMLYHLLTGRPPFVGTSPAGILQLVDREEPIRPGLLNPEVPPDLETLCLKCLEKEPDRRYATAGALAGELERFLRGEPIQARPVRHTERVWRWCRRNRGLAALGGTVLALLVLVAAGTSIAAVVLARESRQRRAAELAAKQELGRARFEQARARRLGGLPGRRFESLQHLAGAVGFQSVETLRHEAIAALALTDVRPLATPPKPTSRLLRGEFLITPEADRYAVLHPDGRMDLRRAVDDQVLATFSNTPPRAEALDSFSPDSRFLLVHHANRLERLWDGETRRVLLEWTNTSPGRSPAGSFSRDSRWFARNLGAQGVDLVELPAGTIRQRFAGVRDPAVDPGGTRLALVGTNGQAVTVMPIGTTNHGTVLAASASKPPVWHPDGRRLAVTGDSRPPQLWDTATGVAGPELGHTRFGAPSHAAFSPDGELLVGLAVGHLRSWSVEAGQSLWELKAPGTRVQFSRDGRRLTTGSARDGRPPVFELGLSSDARPIRDRAAESDSRGVDRVSFSSDGRWLAWTPGAEIRIWHVPSFRLVARLPNTFPRSLAFDPGHPRLMVIEDFGLTEWPVSVDPATGAATLGPRANWLGQGVAGQLFRSGDHLMVSTPTGRLRLRSRDDPALRAAAAATPSISLLSSPQASSPDGRWQLSRVLNWQTHAYTLCVVDATRAGSPQATNHIALQGAAAADDTVFTRDSQLAIVGTTAAIEAWNTSNWTRRWLQPRYDQSSNQGKLARADDDFMLAASIASPTVSLLSPATGTEFARIESPDREEVTGLTFSADRTLLAVVRGNHRLEVWDLAWLHRQLTDLRIEWPDPVLAAVAPRSEVPTPEVTVTGAATNSLFAERSPGTPDGCIDLSPHYNAALHENWHGRQWIGNNLSSLPTGRQGFGGVDFDVRGIVQLGSRALEKNRPGYPAAVRGIVVNRRCERLHFLHAAAWGASVRTGTVVARYVVHYADGSTADIPVRVGEDLLEWQGNHVLTELKGARIAWRGRSPAGSRIQLCLKFWTNPQPGLAVAAVDFVSSGTDVAPFLIGLTAE